MRYNKILLNHGSDGKALQIRVQNFQWRQADSHNLNNNALKNFIPKSNKKKILTKYEKFFILQQLTIKNKCWEFNIDWHYFNKRQKSRITITRAFIQVDNQFIIENSYVSWTAFWVSCWIRNQDFEHWEQSLIYHRKIKIYDSFLFR